MKEAYAIYPNWDVSNPRTPPDVRPRMGKLGIVAGTAAMAASLAACGGPSTTAKPSPSSSATVGASPSQAARVLFGVLEARRCKALEPAACEDPINSVHDTGAIAGLDGFAVAKTNFTPRAIPAIGNAAPVLDLEGQVAAGGLYFIDGKGVVRRLEPGGGVKTVATFPIVSPQQTASFAVSPDGTHLMAAVFTVPNNSPSSDPNEPFGHFSGPYRLQLEAATPGGSTSIVKTWQSGTNQPPDSPGGFTNIVLAGWDGQGPIALVHAATGTQNAWLDNQRWFDGNLARLHTDGTLGPAIGPADCLPYWRPTAGRFACTRIPTGNQAGTEVNVVGLDGTVIWTGAAPTAGPGQLGGGFAVSPDGTRLAMDGQVVTLASNPSIRIASNFTPEGWLTSDTIIGLIPAEHTAGTLGIVRLSDPLHVENWGFSGTFVGTLLAGSSGEPAL
jgi:hypothetical protein